MIKANSGTPGIMYKAANGSLAAITLLDTGATNPTSRLWLIYRWPGNIASAPTVASNTSNPATFTPPQDFSTYTVDLMRTETDASVNHQYLIIEVPDSTGRAIPSAGTDAALLNASQAMLDTGWAGGAVASEKLLEQVVRDNSTGVDVLTAAVAVHETRLDADELDIANLTTTVGDLPQPYDKNRTRYTTNTLIDSDFQRIEVDTTGGAVTLTVPGSSTLEAGRFFEIVHVLGTAAVTLVPQSGHETDSIGGVVPYRGGVTFVNDAAGNWLGQNSWCSLYGIQIPTDAVLFTPVTDLIQANSSGGIKVGKSASTDTIKLLAGSYVSVGLSGTADELTFSKVSTSIIITGIENDLKFSATASLTLDINGTKLGAFGYPSSVATFTLDSARSRFAWEAGATGQYMTFNGKLGQYLLADSAYMISVEPNVISLFNSGGSPFGGVKVLFVANRTTAPTSDPTGGGLVYEEAGALVHRGSSGTITTIAPA